MDSPDTDTPIHSAAAAALKESLLTGAPSPDDTSYQFFPPSFANKSTPVPTATFPSSSSSTQQPSYAPSSVKSPHPSIDAYHTLTIDQVCQILHISSPDHGLSSKDARARLKKYGANTIKHTNRWWPIKMLLSHTLNFMNFVLFFAAVISLIVREWIDAGVIFFVILLNIFIGVVQEFRSERTMKALQKLSQTECDVTRDGALTVVETNALVVGDVVHLKEGDIVPADLRLYRTSVLEIDESTLTGESEAIMKDANHVYPLETPLGERLNMAYSGSIVLKGKGRGIVVGTGFKTELGKIASSITKAKQHTPKIVQRMNVLGFVLVLLGAVAFGLMMLGFAIHKQMPIWPDGVESGVTTLVAIVPESLAPVLTLTMTLGVLKMVKERAIVRKLTALESLGNVDVIATDKTGTLTKGRMQMTSLVVAGERYEITGGAVEPVGELRNSTGKRVDNGHLSPALRMAAVISSLCNSSTVKRVVDPGQLSQRRKIRERRHKKTLREGDWVAIGSPTEIALNVFGQKMGFTRASLSGGAHLGSSVPKTGAHTGRSIPGVGDPTAQYPELIREYAFDSSIKRMTSVYRSNLPEDKGHYFVVSKGAPDHYLDELCAHEISSQTLDIEPLDAASVESIRSSQELMASEGLRVLCLAYRRIPIAEFVDDRAAVEKDLTFLGLCGIYDAPRESVFDAIRIAHEAGIIVVMVTGDFKSTALSIAKEIGIIKDIEAQAHLVITASEFDSLTDEQLLQMPQLPLVIARCSPESKVKLVNALHARKKVVAMTGDGVNDSPALKSANVGIVMGRGGSDVSREVADIILTDDDFSSVVVAVQEGRRVFSSIRKFIIHMLSTNVSQTIILVGSVLIGLMPPLNPTQVLFLNMISAGPPPSIALGASGEDEGIMDRKVRPVHEDLFTWDTILDIGYYGFTMGLVVLGVYLLTRYRLQSASYEEAQAVAFGALTVVMLLHVYNCRNRYLPFFDRGFYSSYKLHAAVLFGLVVTLMVTYIPWVNREIFHMLPLNRIDILEIFFAAVIFMILAEIYKGAKRQVRHWHRKLCKNVRDDVDLLYGKAEDQVEKEEEVMHEVDTTDEENDNAVLGMMDRDATVINIPKMGGMVDQDTGSSRRKYQQRQRRRYPMPDVRERLLRIGSPGNEHAPQRTYQTF